MALNLGKNKMYSVWVGKKTKKRGRILCQVKRVTAVEYLGIHIDEKMKGMAHADGIFKKYAGRISFLDRHS